MHMLHWTVLAALMWTGPDVAFSERRDAGFGLAFSRSPQSEPAIAGPRTPSARSFSSDEQPKEPFETLELSVRTFFNFLQHPNPVFRDVVGIRDDTRLLWIKRSGINQTTSGERMRQFLLALFAPDDGTVFRFADPVVFADGPYGRFARKFSIEEEGRKPECATFYGEAVHQRATGWRFTQLTIVGGERFVPCNILTPSE